MHYALYDWILFQLLVCFHTDLTDETELANLCLELILIPFLYLELRHYKVSSRREALGFSPLLLRVNSKYCNASDFGDKNRPRLFRTGLGFLK
jgi:hypothetical protein